jgi:predicted Fe-S protein YdhL (DUF1289 family)
MASAQIETPCIRQCRLDPHRQYCISCKRTVEQLVNWVHYTPEQRQKIMDNLR